MARKLPFESEIGEMLEAMYPLADKQYDVIGRRFTSRKLADAIAMTEEGFFVLIECKATRKGVLPFARIKDHQRKNLSIVASTKHGVAQLALNFRELRAPGRAYLIPWGFWTSWEDLWLKKSIRADEAIECFGLFELRRITGGWEPKR